MLLPLCLSLSIYIYVYIVLLMCSFLFVFIIQAAPSANAHVEMMYWRHHQAHRVGGELRCRVCLPFGAFVATCGFSFFLGVGEGGGGGLDLYYLGGRVSSFPGRKPKPSCFLSGILEMRGQPDTQHASAGFRVLGFGCWVLGFGSR